MIRLKSSVTRLILAVGALGLILWFALGLAAFLPTSRASFDMSYVDQGEALLHAAHPASVMASWRMPMGPLLEALFFVHSSPVLAKLWIGLLAASVTMLLLALGGLLGSLGCGVLAAGLWQYQFENLPAGPGLYKEFFFTPIVLLVVCLMRRRVRAPSPWRGLLLGCAIGASLLYRSTLVLLPPFLTFCDLCSAYRRSIRPDPKQLLLLLIVPYLFLLPWIKFNWALSKRFIPLENGANASMVQSNTVTAALGVVMTAGGDYRRLMEAAGAKANDSVPVWAAKQVALQPGRYLKSCAKRLRYVFFLNPVLLLLAALGLWRGRGKPELRQIGIFALYYLGLHCLLSIEDNYFRPLWPVLAVPAAAFLILPPKTAGHGFSLKLSDCLVKTGFAALMAISLFTFYVLDGYAKAALRADPASPSALASASIAHPKDGWLAFENGRAQESLPELSRALGLQPDLPRIKLELAWQWAKIGRAAPLLGQTPLHPPAFSDDIRLRVCLYKALYYLGRRQTGPAQGQLELALRSWRDSTRLLEVQSAQDARYQEILRGSDESGFLGAIEHALEGKSQSDRLSLVETLARMRPANAAFWLETARLAARQGRAELEQEALFRAEKINHDAGPLQRLAARYQDSRQFAQAALLYDRLAREHPSRAGFLKDRGVCEFLGGFSGKAALSLHSAIKLDPSLLEAYLSLAAVYLAENRYKDALKAYDAGLSAGARDGALGALLAQGRAELLSTSPLRP